MPEQNPAPRPDRIDEIVTNWQDLHDPAREAREALYHRYSHAIRKYLIACVGSEEAASDLMQIFFVKFLDGQFRNANPEKGRFRDLLKTSLYHMVCDYHSKQKRQPHQMPSDGHDPADSQASMYDSDREFIDNWRKSLLSKAWAALKEYELRKGRPVHTVLYFKAEHPEMPSHDMATALSVGRETPVTGEWVRQWLKKGREVFASCLLDEVKGSLEKPTPDRVEEELQILNLHGYCFAALEEWREEYDGGRG